MKDARSCSCPLARSPQRLFTGCESGTPSKRLVKFKSKLGRKRSRIMPEEKLSDGSRAAAPALHDEVERYRKFDKLFAVIAPGAVLILAYGLCFLYPNPERLATQLGSYFPFLEPRLLFLREHDYNSYVSYAATVLAISISIPTQAVILVTAYWKVAVQSQKRLKASGRTGLRFVIGIFGCYIIFWMAFSSVPQAYSPQWPGMARILFWPVFPFIATLAASTLANLLFPMIIGVVRLTILRGTNNG